MMAMNHTTTRELHDAFYELAMVEPWPDPATLDTLTRLYPDAAFELTRFAIDLTIDRLSGDASFEPEQSDVLDPAVMLAISRFHNKMFELNRDLPKAARRTAEPLPQNPFRSLDQNSFKATATALGANPAFVMKLRDRRIVAETIPQAFLDFVSNVTTFSREVLWSHLSAGSNVIPTGQHFKSDAKPVSGRKQTFEEAVRSSGLTDGQVSHLLSFVS